MTIQSLIEQRKQLETQIAEAKADAVRQVLATIKSLELTWADFGVEPIKPQRAARTALAVKYRDDKGNTWTGVGKRPNWVRAALDGGATLEQFRVPA